MIYCLEPELYPTINQLIEEISYQDENDFEWKIARVQNGFFVRYFGNDYFKKNMFVCDLPSEKIIRINNTNCIFIQNSDLEVFAEVRNVLKTGHTDDIWETFEEMFTERFTHDERMLKSEFLTKKL